MEILRECPALFKNVSTHHVCPYHQRFPGANYAGCTCGGSFSRVRKTEAELTDQDKKDIAAWNKVNISWMDAPIKVNADGTPFKAPSKII